MTKSTSLSTGTIAIAATAALVFSTALYEQENIMPMNFYDIPQNDYISISNTISLDSINNLDYSILDKIEIMNDFVKILTVSSIDLDSEIVDLVNDNFWDLI